VSAAGIPAAWPEKPRPLKGGWKFSTSHSQSSYGIPVLVDPYGEAHGPGDMLSLVQAAELRGVFAANLRRKVAHGSFPAIKIGRNWAVLAADAVRK
jgi:hypothetical protein